jgi:hypothetical protein
MTDTTKPVAVKALERIARWHGEFPETGQFWDDEKTRPISYGAALGSNGERDFMRKVASDALAQIAALSEAPAPEGDVEGGEHPFYLSDATKIVPHQPTPEMIAAAMRADQDGMSASMKTIWMVMWAAYAATTEGQDNG